MPHLESCPGLAGTSAFNLNNFLSQPGSGLTALSTGSRKFFHLAVARRNEKRAALKQEAQLRYSISSLLHEPEQQVQQWLQKNRCYLARVERFRNKTQSRARLQAHKASFRFQQRQEFEELIRLDSRSRILLGFHFGDFIYGNNVVADSEPASRRQCFLTQLPPTDHFLKNMRSCFGEVSFNNRQQLIADNTTPAELAAHLRRPQCSLLSFVDLPVGFGERVQVNFLGRRAWFPKGPATLALVCKIPLLPVMNWWDGRLNRVQLFEQIEPRVVAGESLLQATTRITQTLVDILETVLLQHPWQWRFLTALPAFFIESDRGSRTDQFHSDKELSNDSGRQAHRGEDTQ